MVTIKSFIKKEEFPFVEIPANNLLYSIGPGRGSPLIDPQSKITSCLRNPIGAPQLAQLVSSGDKVVVIADDITRPTPRQLIIPPLLDKLNQTGVQDDNITILIALGTHRFMSREEVTGCFGTKLLKRVDILNHRWDKPAELVDIGKTEMGTPIVINRRVMEADFVIGMGSIVPHCQAGWGGGAKIIRPGVCSEETTSKTHMLAARQDDYLKLAGDASNPVRQEIERVAIRAGLRFILNVVFNVDFEVIGVVAGDLVEAHREGVTEARKIFVRTIEDLADIVIVDAKPADIDYWQGIKPLSYARQGVKQYGIIILVGDFPDGVSPIHTELCTHGQKSPEKLMKLEKEGELQDGVCAASLLLHGIIREETTVICVSQGISKKDKKSLGFIHAENVESALAYAFSKKGNNA